MHSVKKDGKWTSGFVPSRPGSMPENKQARIHQRSALASMLPQYDVHDVVHEVMRLLIAHPDVASPMSMLQEEYGRCMNNILVTNEGAGVVGGKFSDAKLSAVAMHDEHMRLSADLLSKDAKIRHLQQRLNVAEAACEKLRDTFSNDISQMKKGPDDSHLIESEVKELKAMNIKLQEHVELLESNISMGFVYSDVEMKNVIHDLEAEKEHLMSRNMQLAQALYETDFEKHQAQRKITHLENKVLDVTAQKELQEKESHQLRGEYDRLKRTLKEAAKMQ